MGRLFWKFLLAFWLTLITAGVGVAVVVSWLHQQDDNGESRRLGDPHAATLLSAGSAALRHGGVEGLRGFLEELARADPMPLFALDDDGRDILGRSVSSAEADRAARLALQATPRSPARRLEIAGKSWLLFVPASSLGMPGHAPPGFRPSEPPDGPPGPPPGPPGRRPPPWLPIGAAALASLAFAALLAWYVVRPIRRLREATRAVAAGRLDTRIGPAMGRRRDELADLGRDFDAMTGQLDGLIGAQRRLFHDVSHELRSPLARLHAAIGLARQDPTRAESSLERIEREAGRLDELVDEVLTLARLESGMVGGASVEFDVGDMVDVILDDARFEAGAKDCRVDLVSAGHARMLGQPDLLGRAIENVLRNALRHSPAGGVVSVAGHVDAPSGRYRVSICDQGPGVAEAELSAIFEPFHRGGQAGGRDGYGLGLAIAKRAIAAHGGDIEASNRPEGGLCVTLSLPLTTHAGETSAHPDR
jgi:two-component system OmpR family sensor kinase